MKHVVVVGAVIVDEGRILCAQRGSGALAGLWEFPGGKVEPGETPQDGLRREVAEELQCDIFVGDEVTTTTHDYDFARVTLTTYWCHLLEGTPQATEHAAVAWLHPTELSKIEWAPADLPAVALASELA